MTAVSGEAHDKFERVLETHLLVNKYWSRIVSVLCQRVNHRTPSHLKVNLLNDLFKSLHTVHLGWEWPPRPHDNTPAFLEQRETIGF